MSRTLLTTTIPYVNAPPHLGFALEIVRADVLARHGRRLGADVRFATGTDDNSLKNVLAAEAAGVPTRELVDRNAAAFAALRDPLALSYDSFVRTSGNDIHRQGVARLWRAHAANGDLYRKHYEGLYCVDCEQFYPPAELLDGRCPEHGTPPRPVAEENWFFRLSRYTEALRELIAGGRLRVEPAARRNEVLSFVSAGLADVSVSRSAARARGWGIPVPGDPDQVVYVWWDALANYVTGLGFGGPDDTEYRRWWAAGGERVHLVGKGVLRFHAVYWPAMLLSAGLPLPTAILVHDYLTANGRKIGKSTGNTVDPVELVDRFGTDAVRWWLLRDVPRTGDADFTVDRLVARANEDLANGVGNLVHRVVSMVHRYRAGRVPAWDGEPLAACLPAPDRVREALAAYDFRAAASAVIEVVDAANRFVEDTRPWQLADRERDGAAGATRELDGVLGVLLHACRTVGEELAPLLPTAADAIAARCVPVGGVLPEPRPLFPRW